MKEVVLAILDMIHAHSIAIASLEERIMALETVVGRKNHEDAQVLQTALDLAKKNLLQKRTEAQQNYEEMRALLVSIQG